MNNKKTSNSVSALASKILRNPYSSDIQKKLAGSTLSQTNTNKQTGVSMETIASKVLRSNKYNRLRKKIIHEKLIPFIKDKYSIEDLLRQRYTSTKGNNPVVCYLSDLRKYIAKGLLLKFII